MSQIKRFKALGVMAASSNSDVGLALISTDGIDVFDFIASSKVLYDDSVKEELDKLMGYPQSESIDYAKIERNVTDFYIRTAKGFLEDIGETPDIIGFERSVLYHDMEGKKLFQIGNIQDFTNALSCDVVSNFHKSDIIAGGQGFPLTPTFYAALTSHIEKPLAIVNISGVSTITWLGAYGDMLAFDAGPGNSALNSWVYKRSGYPMDYNGKLGISGKVDEKILDYLMKNKFIAKLPPKSVQSAFFEDKLGHLEGLSLEDGAATVTAFIAEAIAYSMSLYLPERPEKVIVCGGGSKNPTIVRFLRQRLQGINVETAADNGWNTNGHDGALAAFLAARRVNFLPITFPSTTGAPEPLIGGDVYVPEGLE